MTIPAIDEPKSSNGKLKTFAIQALMVAGALGILWIIGHPSSHTDAISAAETQSPTTETKPSAPESESLELEANRWTIESRYVIMFGQVKNVSGASLDGVMAVASYFDADGNFIASSDALIEYDPILAGQTSPYRVLCKADPAMKRGQVEFKKFGAGTMRFRDGRRGKL